MNGIYTACGIVCGVCAVIVTIAGFNWIDTGYGLHPMLAGPLATLMVVLPIVITTE